MEPERSSKTKRKIKKIIPKKNSLHFPKKYAPTMYHVFEWSPIWPKKTLSKPYEKFLILIFLMPIKSHACLKKFLEL